jgi:hypothetical protein
MATRLRMMVDAARELPYVPTSYMHAVLSDSVASVAEFGLALACGPSLPNRS